MLRRDDKSDSMKLWPLVGEDAVSDADREFRSPTYYCATCTTCDPEQVWEGSTAPAKARRHARRFKHRVHVEVFKTLVYDHSPKRPVAGRGG